MSDQSLGRADRLDVPAAPRQPWRLAPGHVHLIVAIAAILIVRRLWVGEGFWSTMAFTGGVCVTIGAVIAVATRRLLVSVAAVAAIVALVSVAAHVKRQAINLVLHAYDLVFYLPQGATLQFLWQSYRVYVAGAVLALALTASMLVLAYRIDPVRIGRPRAALTAVGFALLSWVSTYAVGERRHTQMEWEGLYLTSFFQSWSETLETLWRGQLMEAAAAASKEPPFRRPANCAPAVKPPHIILVHHESIVQPSLFPQLAYDRSVDPFFRSDDGRVHQLRVETYGGASTMTEFSVLTGLSTYSFGGMRQFVQSIMEDKIRDTLPQALELCGYRNVVFYPMLKNFVSNARFYQSVGLKEIFDLKDQGATKANERDRFYYGNALAEMERAGALQAEGDLPGALGAFENAAKMIRRRTHERARCWNGRVSAGTTLASPLTAVASSAPLVFLLTGTSPCCSDPTSHVTGNAAIAARCEMNGNCRGSQTYPTGR